MGSVVRGGVADMQWSDELSQAILSSLSDEQVERLLREFANEAGGSILANGDRDELLARCRTDSTMRMVTMSAWRQAHPDVIAAAQFVAIDRSAEQCAAITGQFSAEEILLELITDEEDDGWALARWTVDNVPDIGLRREFAALLERWSGAAESINRPSDSEATFRIVIFGGHQRDESKMERRLFENSPFEVRWKPCEKNQGSPDDRDLNAAMAHVDAVLLVTTMVSHNIMRIVKRFTQENGIPLRMIPKATDQQLRVALTEIFPSVVLPDG